MTCHLKQKEYNTPNIASMGNSKVEQQLDNKTIILSHGVPSSQSIITSKIVASSCSMEYHHLRVTEQHSIISQQYNNRSISQI